MPSASMTIDELAEQLYEACPTSKPSWDQLGEVTKSVWRERAEARRSGASIGAAAGPLQLGHQATAEQGSLF